MGAGGEPVIALSDVHGYLDEAVELLDAAGDADHIEPLIDYRYQDGQYTEVIWTGGDQTLVLNGDLIARGPQNREALEFVWDLQDSAKQQGYEDGVVYTLGNQEAYALCPERTVQVFNDKLGTTMADIEMDKDAYYWWHMDDDMRDELALRIRQGDIVAVFEHDDILYSHAGMADETAVDAINETVQYGEEMCPEEEYLELIGKDGELWPAFEKVVETADRPQVVGHTPARFCSHSEPHPAQYGNVINTDSILEYVNGKTSEYGLVVEEQGEVYALRYDGECVEQEELGWLPVEAEEGRDASLSA